MTKKAFDKIAAGLNDAIAFAHGNADPATYRIHVPAEVDVKAIRKSLGLTQAEFGLRYGFGPRVRDWEQKRKAPDAATRAYLRVIEKEPQAVARALELEDA